MLSIMVPYIDHLLLSMISMYRLWFDIDHFQLSIIAMCRFKEAVISIMVRYIDHFHVSIVAMYRLMEAGVSILARCRSLPYFDYCHVSISGGRYIDYG